MSPSASGRRGGAARSRSGKPQRSGPSRRRGKPGFWAKLFGGAVLALLLGATGLFAWSFVPGEVLGDPATPVHFHVESSDKTAVIDALVASRLLASPLLTRLYAQRLTLGADFTPRAHLLTPGISARELVQRLAEVGSRSSAEVTFPEGWTHMQMAARLEQLHICSELGFQAAAVDQQLLSELGIPPPSAEGYLFPATYRFSLDSDPRQVVRRLIAEARKRFEKVGLADSKLPGELKKAGLTAHGALILASIVERETGVTKEAPRVARVFINRLSMPEAETKGRLQSDPTAGYGCQLDALSAPSCRDYVGRILPEMLEDKANVYNTYRHAGLPPGPISNPGERTIRAVLAPSAGRELYFVADGKGGHTFTETYAEHRAAVRRLKSSVSPAKNR